MAKKLELSGYEQHKEVMAQRYRKGNHRWVYIISLPLHLIPTHLPIPDPETPFPGNRRVNKRHADKFGEYWRSTEKWATPPLLLDTMYPLGKGFESEFEVAGVEFGRLKLPHNSAAELDILDGQHRILGWKSAIDGIAQDLKSARMELQRSREAENESGVQIYAAKVEALTLEQERLHTEYVTLELMEGITLEDHKQVFHDIAVNARGITKSVTVSFDRRNVLNRIAMDLAETHELLAGRVDMEKDRVVGGNENLVSGRNLVDLVRHVALGIDGRMTARRESEMRESALADMAELFLKALTDCFPDMQKVMDDEVEAVDLRERSLLASPTVLRVLAGAYHIIAVDLSDETRPHVTAEGDAKARKLFAELSGHMAFPVEDGWLATGFFPSKESKAPSSRAQDLKALTKEIADWADEGTPF